MSFLNIFNFKVKTIYVILALVALILIVSYTGSINKYEGFSSQSLADKLKRIMREINEILKDINVYGFNIDEFKQKFFVYMKNYVIFKTTINKNKYTSAQDANKDGLIVINADTEAFIRDNSGNAPLGHDEKLAYDVTEKTVDGFKKSLIYYTKHLPSSTQTDLWIQINNYKDAIDDFIKSNSDTRDRTHTRDRDTDDYDNRDRDRDDYDTRDRRDTRDRSRSPTRDRTRSRDRTHTPTRDRSPIRNMSGPVSGYDGDSLYSSVCGSGGSSVSGVSGSSVAGVSGSSVAGVTATNVSSNTQMNSTGSLLDNSSSPANSSVVQNVPSASPSNLTSSSCGSKCNPAPVPPCPPCERCPEPAFDCKKVPNYNSFNQDFMPVPVLNSFSTFGM